LDGGLYGVIDIDLVQGDVDVAALAVDFGQENGEANGHDFVDLAEGEQGLQLADEAEGTVADAAVG